MNLEDSQFRHTINSQIQNPQAFNHNRIVCMVSRKIHQNWHWIHLHWFFFQQILNSKGTHDQYRYLIKLPGKKLLSVKISYFPLTIFSGIMHNQIKVFDPGTLKLTPCQPHTYPYQSTYIVDTKLRCNVRINPYKFLMPHSIFKNMLQRATKRIKNLTWKLHLKKLKPCFIHPDFFHALLDSH